MVPNLWSVSTLQERHGTGTRWAVLRLPHARPIAAALYCAPKSASPGKFKAKISTRQWAASCASGTALCANTVVIPTGSNSTTAKRQWQESPSCSALCQTTSTQIFAVRCCNLMASKPVTLQATKKEVPEPNFYPDSMTLTAQTLTCPRPDKSQRTTECQVL